MKLIIFCIMIFLQIYFNLQICKAQNIVVDVWAKVTSNNKVLKKGDNLPNNAKLYFQTNNSQIKLLTPKGIVLIKNSNVVNYSANELTELISASIHKNSVATLGTRSWEKTLSVFEEVAIIDSLCLQLNANKDNIEFIATNYINPYCVSEFKKKIYWKEIGEMLHNKYEYNFYNSTGNILSAEEYTRIPLAAKVKTRDYLPSVFSIKKYCPIPGNQGKYGTCVGWASAYGARTISWAIKNNDTVTNDITNQAFSPTFVYEQIKSTNDIDCSIGSSISSALHLLRQKGVPFISDLNYGCGVNIFPFLNVAINYKIKDYQKLTGEYGISENEYSFNQNLMAIKIAISQKKPVLASIDCYQSFAGKVWNGLLDKNRGGHAICIVGYDDNFLNGEGAVEMMNSWGTYWGDGGFIWVKYADLKHILTSALTLYDDIKSIPLDPPSPPNPKPNDPKPLPVFIDTLNRMQGSFSLILKDGNEMPLEVNTQATRGLKLSNVESMTYNIKNSYPAGTLFRLQFTSSLPAYIYVFSTDSKRSPLTQLFPNPEENISALLNFSSEVTVAIPDSSQFIQMDETKGEDYLCVIYSKDKLDISILKDELQNKRNKSFVKIVKETLADNIADESEVQFEKNKIAFKAVSTKHTAIPIFVKINHN